MMMTIREFNENDRRLLQDIYLNGRIETFTWADHSAYTLDDFDRDTLGEQIFVAEQNGVITGFAAVLTADSFIHHLYVSAGYHDKGVGTALLNAAVNSMENPVRLKCLIKNHHAVGFYKKLGWKFEMTGNDTLGRYYLLKNQ